MKKLFAIAFCALLLLAFTLSVPIAKAENALYVDAREALLMNADGDIVYAQNETEKRPIASMTKIMTLLCVFDAIDEGKISIDDEVVVSQRAASMGGSQVYLDANATYKVSELIKSIVVCSANDSCVALAEYVSGSVENFVQLMNEKSDELGLVASNFENCTGLPAVSQYSCAKDVARMFACLLKHKSYFDYSTIWMEDFEHPSGRVTGMTNTNKLVKFYEGCDGGKTGFTNESLFCLSATAKRGDTRLIAVVVGAPDSKTRFAEVSKLFNYGFANYESKVLVDSESAIKVDVQNGKCNTVAAVVRGGLTVFGRKGTEYTYEYILDNVKAPVKCGDVVGKICAYSGGTKVAERDVVAVETVETKGYFDYVKDFLLW